MLNVAPVARKGDCGMGVQWGNAVVDAQGISAMPTVPDATAEDVGVGDEL
jgi:hypothetical protein